MLCSLIYAPFAATSQQDFASVNCKRLHGVERSIIEHVKVRLERQWARLVPGPMTLSVFMISIVAVRRVASIVGSIEWLSGRRNDELIESLPVDLDTIRAVRRLEGHG